MLFHSGHDWMCVGMGEGREMGLKREVVATEVQINLHEGLRLEHISLGRKEVKKLALLQMYLYIIYLRAQN